MLFIAYIFDEIKLLKINELASGIFNKIEHEIFISHTIYQFIDVLNKIHAERYETKFILR